MVKQRTHIDGGNFQEYLDYNAVRNNVNKESRKIEIEYVGGENEDYYVNKDGEENIFSMKYFRIYLKNLRQVADYSISSLSPDLVSQLYEIISARKILKGTNGQSLLLNESQKIFADVDIVKPNTVAAYFKGCFVKDNFTGSKVCNPRCSPGFLPEGEEETCDSLVIIFHNGNFIISNEGNSGEGAENAYIYVDALNFNGFSEDEIKSLKDLKIKTIVLVYSSDDGSNDYKEISGKIDIDNAPIEGNEKRMTPNNENMGIFIFIIFLFLLLIVIGVFYASRT